MKRTNYSLLVLMCVAIFSWTAKAQEFAGGTGTQIDPFLISTPQQLENMRTYTAINDGSASVSVKYFKLVADIDLASVSNWVPLSTSADGTTSQSYGYMNFDGDGHVIKNMTSKYPGTGYYANYWGFAGILCGSIKNTGFVNVDVLGTDAGPIAGAVGRGTPAVGSEALQRGTIENCFVTGKVSGTARIGGVAGQIGTKGSYIKNCYSTCDVTNTATSGSANFTGGVVGVVAGTAATNPIAVSYVENCYATGNVVSQIGRAGGVLGMANGGAILNGVAFNKSITMNATDSVGTIAGFIHSVSVPLCTGEYLAKNNISMMQNGTAYTPRSFSVVAGRPIDGISKDNLYLSNPANYTSLGFPIGSIWANDLVNQIYPQLLWVSLRSDAAQIDGISESEVTTVYQTHIDKNIIKHSISASGYLTIQTKEIIQKVEIFNLNGQMIYAGANQNDEVNIDLSSFCPAIYIVNATTSEKSYTIKIVKK